MLTSTRICQGAILFLLSVLANGFTTTSVGRRAGRQQLATTTSSRSSTTSLYGSPSDRARYEKEFEDMMDNDWRAFRAKLVAQEANGGIPVAPSTTHAHHREQQQKQQSSRHVEQHVPQQTSLNRQSQLGDIFAKSISSIFDGGHHNNANQAPMKQAQQETQQQPQGGKRRVLYKDANRYSGGESSHIPNHRHHNKNHDSSPPSAPPMHQQHFTTPSFIEDTFQDPFVSAAELPLFLRETKINKNRWAHEIPHVEPGCVLIANEKLGGVFHQTVVLIIQHCERSGSIGIVINRYVSCLVVVFFLDTV
jgi:putative transcriptional regulator